MEKEGKLEAEVKTNSHYSQNNFPRKAYSLEEVSEGTLKYFKGDKLSADAWINKYALKDSKGNIYEKSPEQMHKRIAKEIARIEKKYDNPMSEEKIYSLLRGFKYIIPQGGPMTGIGNNYQIVSLSNCFVIGYDADSYGAIIKTEEEQVQLMKRRGGVGHDLSPIRPKGSPVKNSALTSTGVVPFMERYSNSTKEVAQDGRRGALMLSLSIKHPDAEQFIDAKLEENKVTNANVSVRIDDEFMEAVKDNKNYLQQFPIDSDNPNVTKNIDAKKLWDKIIHNAWKSAEPGILFWDTITKESIPDNYADKGFKTTSTNPCGEIPLCPYDSCRLLAINLYGYVDKPFTKEANFNLDLFKEHTGYAQRIMDDIIDLEIEKVDSILEKLLKDPEDAEIKRTEIKLWKNIKQKAIKGRRTGVGITAEGDMLAGLGLQYGSQDAIEFVTEIHKTLAIEAYRSSINMAKERGAFEIYDSEKEKDNPFVNRIKDADPRLYEEMVKHGRRNISLLTIAPTGTTSMMTQTTSGIEPAFSMSYKRRRKINPNDKEVKIDLIDKEGISWEEYNVFHHKFEKWLEVNNYDIEEVKKYGEEDLNKIIEKSPYYKATSNDIDWVQKVKMQGEIQKWVDHSISVTVNLPEDISREKVGEVYMAAWKAGCKGVTVYREGSREGILISGKDKKNNKFPLKRPKSLDAEVLRFRNGEENWMAFIGLINDKPYEIFTGRTDEDILAVPKSITEGKIVKKKDEKGKSQYDFVYTDRRGIESTIGGISHQFKKENWNYARFISTMLRKEIHVNEIAETISKLEDVDEINSWKSGAIRALKKYIPNGTKTNKECEECHVTFFYQEGCKTCGCGSKCE